jgi:glycosyltransferase involved in cell wall biosynthesis
MGHSPGKRALIVHFTPPSVIGGVESIMAQHAELLSDRGWRIEFLAGRSGRSRFPLHVLPALNPARPAGLELEKVLADGDVPDYFSKLEAQIGEKLEELAGEADVVIAHNAFTLHFCMPLTAALWKLAEQRPMGSVIAWCHDLSWTNPLYIPTMHVGYPWELLRTQAPNTQYVTVSHERKFELVALWNELDSVGTVDEPGVPAQHTAVRDNAQPSVMDRLGASSHVETEKDSRVTVIPNGIDPERFLRLSPATRHISKRYRFFDRDMVLLLPVRITRRKNIEAAIRAVGCLRDRGLDVLFVVSGPVAPHHPGLSITYLGRLKALREELGLDEAVVFLADALGERLADRTVSELYTVADALLFPSAQEGFGLPILEAGLARTPVILSDIPIFREVSDDDTVVFDLDDPPDTIASKVVAALDTGPSRLYRRIMREFRWDAIMDQKIVPLLLAAPTTNDAATFEWPASGAGSSGKAGSST